MADHLLADAQRAADLRAAAADLPSLNLSPRQVDEVELLLSGAYAPLRGFLGQADYRNVLEARRLTDGTLWPHPLALEVEGEVAAPLAAGCRVALRDPEGVVLAVMDISDNWPHGGRHLLGGPLEGLTMPPRYDHGDLRPTPAEARSSGAVAFFTAGVLHRGEVGQCRTAARERGTGLMIGVLAAGATDIFHRVRCLRAALPHAPDRTAIALLPLPAPDGPEGVLLQALVAKNYGCPALLSSGDTSLAEQHTGEIGIDVVAVTPGSSDDSYPEVLKELRRANPPRSEAGLTVFFTGLSGSGKSTIANLLRARMMERGGRQVTLLDGDLVRKNLSSELTFSKAHRDLNVLRIGFVANEITKNGGLAICAPIAPYDAIRKRVREQVEGSGGFVLVHVATPLEVCEARDRKGLYAMARAGKIGSFTGISDPYEEPADAELTIQTTEMGADEACDKVIAYLESNGYLAEEF